MGLHDETRITVKKLIYQATNGRDSVRNLITELKDAGYITTEWKRDEVSGKYTGLEYVVHELPQALQEVVPGTEDTFSVSQAPEIMETDNQSPEDASPEMASRILSINNTNKDQNNKLLIKAASIKPATSSQNNKINSEVLGTENYQKTQ